VLVAARAPARMYAGLRGHRARSWEVRGERKREKEGNTTGRKVIQLQNKNPKRNDNSI
jgi:hypothetical protein